MSIRRISIMVAVLVLGLARVVPAKADDKIALVSLQKALNEVNEGKAAKDKLKKDFDVKKKQIDSMKAELETMSKAFEKEKMVLSDEALKTKTQTLQSKYLELQTKAAEYERELKAQESATATKILTALRLIVTEISAKEGYTLVLENSAETVLYSKTAEDITAKVITQYNSK